MSIQPCIQCYGPVKKGSIFCTVCNSIQPFISSNPFSMFDLPVCFDLDNDSLDKKYIQFLKKLHPDQFSGETENIKLLATKHSSKINEYFEHLKNPKLRAMWLYVLLIGENHLGKFPQNSQMPSEFLMESMELSMKIESTNNESELKNIKAVTKRKEQEKYAEIAKNVLEKDEKMLLLNIHFLNFLEKALVQISTKGI